MPYNFSKFKYLSAIIPDIGGIIMEPKPKVENTIPNSAPDHCLKPNP